MQPCDIHFQNSPSPHTPRTFCAPFPHNRLRNPWFSAPWSHVVHVISSLFLAFFRFLFVELSEEVSPDDSVYRNATEPPSHVRSVFIDDNASS